MLFRSGSSCFNVIIMLFVNVKRQCLGRDLIASFEVRQLNGKALQAQHRFASTILLGKWRVSWRKTQLDSATTLPGLSGGCIRQPKAVVGDELRFDRLLEAHLEANSLSESQHNSFSLIQANTRAVGIRSCCSGKHHI